MFFNYMSETDESGIDYSKLAEYKAIVFCCLVKSVELCDVSVFDSLEALAQLDRKFYAIFKTQEMKNRIESLIKSSFKGVELPKSDYFLVLKNKSFISGKPVGLQIIPLSYNGGINPDDQFIEALHLLKKEVSKINRKIVIVEITKKAFEELIKKL